MKTESKISSDQVSMIFHTVSNPQIRSEFLWQEKSMMALRF